MHQNSDDLMDQLYDPAVKVKIFVKRAIDRNEERDVGQPVYGHELVVRMTQPNGDVTQLALFGTFGRRLANRARNRIMAERRKALRT